MDGAAINPGIMSFLVVLERFIYQTTASTFFINEEEIFFTDSSVLDSNSEGIFI